MDLVNSSYLPGDPLLVDKIVYELKAQGIFDQFRKECISDVDTKPAYQNLRQRVEGSVSGFLRKQKWNPDMNKNQVREMLRKSIYESGFLETGVERIVNQVVNPKIEKVFQPKVADVVYTFLGIQKPKKDTSFDRDESTATENLLPTDLEAVSPEYETNDKKQDKSLLDDSKNEEDESPPFEPLEEQPAYLPPDENSVDSHLSGFSGLASHDSNSNENTANNKSTDFDIFNQDSQISKQSFEDRTMLSVGEETDSKFEGCDDSRASKSSKSQDSPIKNFDFSPETLDKGSNSSKSSKKDKARADEKPRAEKKSDSYKHRPRQDSKSDSKNDKKNDKKEPRDKHKDSRDSSKDSRERRDSKSSNRNNKDKERRSSSSKHSSTSREHSTSSSSKKESSSKEEKPKSSHKDHRRDSKSNSKTTQDKYRKDDRNHRSHSSSSKSDKDRGDSKKEARKENKDDHFSSKGKKSERRSTDRDSNDGHSGTSGNGPTALPDTGNVQQSDKQQESGSNSGSGSNDSVPSDRAAITSNCSVIKLIKPKFASNIHEARKLMKIRKQLHKLEKRIFENNVPTAINDDTKLDEKKVPDNNPELEERKSVSPPPFQTTVSAACWDAIEAKLNSQINYNSYEDYSDIEAGQNDSEDYCLYLPNQVPPETLRCKEYIENLINDELRTSSTYDSSLENELGSKGVKRKMSNHENDLQNNNKKYNLSIQAHNESFPLPLSPAESDASIDKKLYPFDVTDPEKNSKAKAAQRYSSDDLYKPRLFNGSRRRTSKIKST